MSDLEFFIDIPGGTEGIPEPMDDSHFREAFSELCENSVVSAQSAIYAENGAKLLDKGARIDGDLYSRLVKHKLKNPIDQQIGMEGMVSVSGLEMVAVDLAETAPVPRLLAASLGTHDPMVLPLRDVKLPAAFALKLTLMRDKYPGLLRQALSGMLVALFLAERCSLPAPLRTALAAAALLRDLGMLHMDPAWLAPERPMSAQERRHLRAHPITSMVLIREQETFPAEVATAVFEHHERLDGTGYPRGARALDISALGQMLMLSELVSAIGQKFGEAAPQRLGLNRRAYPPALVAVLLPVLQAAAPLPADSTTADDCHRQFTRITSAFEKWAELLAPLPAVETGSPACSWLNARLTGLRQALTEAGGPPEDIEFLLAHAAGDALHMAETLVVGREALWQLDSICGDALQRWPQLGDSHAQGSPGESAAGKWCRWAATMLAAP